MKVSKVYDGEEMADENFNRTNDGDGIRPCSDTGFRFVAATTTELPRKLDARDAIAVMQYFERQDYRLASGDLKRCPLCKGMFDEGKKCPLCDVEFERIDPSPKMLGRIYRKRLAIQPATRVVCDSDEAMPELQPKVTEHREKVFTLSDGTTLRACACDGCNWGRVTAKGGWVQKHSNGLTIVIPEVDALEQEPDWDASSDDPAELSYAAPTRVAGDESSVDAELPDETADDETSDTDTDTSDERQEADDDEE